MAKTIKKEKAARLWEVLGVTVENVRPAPRQHRGDVIFCGYADIILWFFDSQEDPLPMVRLCGNSIKIIGDQVHFDPKAEEGKGSRKGQWFGHWLPEGPESRAVLTKKLANCPEIKELIALAQTELNKTQALA